MKTISRTHIPDQVARKERASESTAPNESSEIVKEFTKRHHREVTPTEPL